MSITFTTKKINLEKLKELLFFLNDSYIPKLSSQIDINNYAEKLNNYAHFIFVKDNLKYIGLIAYYISENESFITSIGIHKDYHGKNIGHQLFEKYVNLLKKENIKKLKLHVAKKNIKAQQFYLKKGIQLDNYDIDNFLGTKLIEY